MGLGLITVFLASSCEDPSVGDDEAVNFNNGISVVQFTTAKINAPAVADGSETTFNVKVLLAGPDIENLTEDVTVNFSIDPSSTAVVGTNFKFDVTSVVLTKANNYLATLPVTIITEGITPPTSPTLVLNIDSVSTTQEDVFVSGNKSQIIVTLAYSCSANLTGTYELDNDLALACNGLPTTTSIAANGEGGWVIGIADGGLLAQCTSNTSLVNTGSILVVCGEVFPQGQISFCASNGIGCITGGTWDPDNGNGVLMMTHNDSFFNGSGLGDYNSTYTRL